ncbi:MAG: asparagine synthase (glutamine-hydrolyzing) [Candidatus Eisenbacteria bacterium]|nr:asparagine synthase (glutamine-hydrolyzing) [Candidatus Eisenbacteria bacterium]
MCGINGVFHYRGGQADAALVRAMALVQRHRGPDDAAVWAEGPVALGHRRLAIVDLSPGGRQPMANENGRVHVAFNGELYNWPEVMPQLAARGHTFRGRSDTEMLLHLWEEKQHELLADVRGMFAFALHDADRGMLMLARDRVGKKPLYWHDDGKRIVFASELKALMRDPSVPRDADARAIADYLTYQYVPSPGSILQGVNKLPAGHYLLCDANGPRVARYWELPTETTAHMSDEDAVAGLRERLTEAVRVRLMSDVPLGAFLSGGVDSSAVVALMAQVSSTRVKTFSIGFEDADFSELSHARAVAEHLGTDHHEQIVRPRALELMPRLVWGLDEPFADASMVPTFHVSEMARDHVTVALSGDGGDEAYAGYTTYAWARSYARVDVLPAFLRRLAALPAGLLPGDHPLGRRLRRMGMSVADRHLEVMSHFPTSERNAVLTRALRTSLGTHDPYAAARAIHAHAARGLGDVAALPALDVLTYMIDDVLVKVDRTSMMNSLETRAPLLDHHVLEWVARLPFEQKLRGATSKWVLREVVRPMLPPGILERPKQGFGVPLDRWFAGDFGRLAREVLLDRRCRERGWLEPAAVESLLAGDGLRNEVRAKRVFTLVALELWAQCYLDRPREQTAAPTDGPYPLHTAVAATASDGAA